MDLIVPLTRGRQASIDVPWLVDDILLAPGLPRGSCPLDQDDMAVATWIQQELYFRLLATALNRSIHLVDYCAGDGTICSTSVTQAIFRIDTCSMYAVLKGALSTFAAALCWTELGLRRSKDKAIGIIILSAKILLCAVSGHFDLRLNTSLRLRLRSPETLYAIQPLIAEQDYKPYSASLLGDRMESRGWCRYYIRKILAEHDYLTAHLLGNLKRKTRDHSKCSEFRCVAWDFSIAPQPSQHRDTHCCCQSLRIDSQKLADVLRKGRIPIIRLARESHQGLIIDIVEYNNSIDYIAISHVWTDGLGNPIANSLPTCQLNYLFSVLHSRSMQGAGRFLEWQPATSFHIWIDVLCIPPAGQRSTIFDDAGTNDFDTIKNLAIQRMNRIYAAARFTIVLDAELQTISCDDPEEVLLAYALYSGWSTRAWTLQEGSLAPQTLFALSDGLYLPKRPLSYIGQLLYDSFLRSRLNLWEQELHSCPEQISDQFTLAWNELCDRSSTQSEDLPAILCNLLGLDTFSTLRATTTLKGRIAIILLSFPVLPASLLFTRSPEIAEPHHVQYHDDADMGLSGADYVDIDSEMSSTTLDIDAENASR